MARLIEKTFDLSKPVTARRYFVAAGRHFKIGDTFDWRRMAVDQRRVKQLFDAGKLMHPHQVTAQNPLPEVKPEPAVEPAVETDGSVEETAPEPTPAAETETEEVVAETVSVDGLDDLNMKELRKIAYAEGAASRTSKDVQIEAIRENRAGGTQETAQ